MPEAVRTGARRRRVIAAAVCVAIAVGAPRSASAAFADGASDSHTLSTAQLAPPTNPGTAAGTCVVAVSDSVVVTWTASTSAWADGYEILRSTTAGGPYTIVGSAAGAGTQSYTDSPLLFSTTYYYVIQSTKGNWRSSPTTETSRSTRSTLCT